MYQKVTVKDLMERLSGKNPDDVIAYVIWQRDDVLTLNDTLTDEEADQVIIRMKQFHDCDIGLTYENMKYHIDEVINERPFETEDGRKWLFHCNECYDCKSNEMGCFTNNVADHLKSIPSCEEGCWEGTKGMSVFVDKPRDYPVEK